MDQIIQDMNMFNRLRNDGIQLECIKKYVENDVYKYLRDEVERLKDRPWACSKCKRILRGYQLMCNLCLDWFHITCLNINEEEASTLTYFCSSCSKWIHFDFST